MKLKNGMTVIAPDGCRENLTAGKEYVVYNVKKDYTFLYCFNIKDDFEKEAFCLLENCAHLNGGNWIIKNN